MPDRAKTLMPSVMSDNNQFVNVNQDTMTGREHAKKVCLLSKSPQNVKEITQDRPQ